MGQRIGSLDLQNRHQDGRGLRVIGYFPVSEGKRVEVGQGALVSPSHVQRERFGSLRGRVARVGEFPITQEAAAERLGNPDLVEPLAQLGGVLEVEVELLRDEDGHYAWTGQPPTVELSSGATASVRVVVERRPPISFLVPLLRQLVLGTEPPPTPATGGASG